MIPLIIIGAIIGAIIVFLICREIVCWYWKINKLVELMEKQNKYFRLILKSQNIDLPDDSPDSEIEIGTKVDTDTEVDVAIPSIDDIPLSGQLCKVIKKTAIREFRKHDSYAEKELNVGDKVYFQKIKNNDPTWYYVKSTDSWENGWCFSGYLEKC